MDPIRLTYKVARRIVVTIAGITVLIVGIVMVFAPGPATVVIPVGLAILGLEFAWARAWLKRIREGISDGAARARGERAESHPPDSTDI